MNRNLKSVSQFLSMYENDERFSSYDGDEYYGTFEGQGTPYSSFTPDNLTSADGGMGMGRKPVSKPYVLNVYTTNTTATVNAILFGYNDNFSAGVGTAGQGAYGNNIAINVSSGIAGVTYERLIGQSQNKPFDIGLWRFSCSNTNQLDQVMNITYVDANGRTATDPVTLTNYKDAYQQQSTIIDVWYPTKIDGNTSLTIPILAATTSSAPLTINMFPRSIADQANRLIGGAGDKGFTTPRLSGRNVPVIQTVAPVRSVTAMGYEGRTM